MNIAARARVAAGLLAVVAIVLLARAEWAAGVGVAAVALAIFGIITERGIPDELPTAAATGGQDASAAMAAALGLTGHGIVFPAATTEEASKLFVPAGDVALADVGAIDLTLTLQRESGAALGVVLAPPGAGLESLWRERHGLPVGRGAEEAAAHLRRAFADLGLGEEVVVARAEAIVRVQYAPVAFAASCQRAIETSPPWHVQGGCPACSFAAILVARAFAAPVRIAASGHEGAVSWIELEVGARSRA